MRCGGQHLRGGAYRRNGAGKPKGRTAVFKDRREREGVRKRRRAGKVQREGREVGADPAGICEAGGARACRRDPRRGHGDGTGCSGAGAGSAGRAYRGQGGADGGGQGRRTFCPCDGHGAHWGDRAVLRQLGAAARAVHMAQRRYAAHRKREHRGEYDAGAAGAGAGFCDRVRQPGVGVQQKGERDLRLCAGRPHQLVQLSGHGSGQLRGDRGQRRAIYGGGKLPWVCAVF